MEAAIKIVPADKALKKTITTLKKESREGEELVELVGKIRKMKPDHMLKALDSIPDKFKFHPAVINLRNVNFPKTTSSGKDLVIFCGYTAEEWTPETIAKKGSGGSEEACITLAQGLADKGWNVTVYNNCGTEEQWFIRDTKLSSNVMPHRHDGSDNPPHWPIINYRPYMSWNYRDKQDVVILWRQTKPLDWEINAPKVFVDMHDVIPAGEFTPDRVKRLSKVFFKSHYHRELYPLIPEDKTVIIPNGVDPNQFETTCKVCCGKADGLTHGCGDLRPTNEAYTCGSTGVIQKKPYLMINTASPVRGLSALIDIMKEVRKEVPEAKMQWAYGWTVTDKGMSAANQAGYAEWKSKIVQGMKEAGIEDLGRLTHREVADLYLKASLYLYPTAFPEIDCMSITKALAAGAFPISTDYGAIKQKTDHGGVFLHSDEIGSGIDYAITSPELKAQFVTAIIDKLKNPPNEQRARMREWALSTYAWDSIISKWNDLCA